MSSTRRDFILRTVLVGGTSALPFASDVFAQAGGGRNLVVNVAPEPSALAIVNGLPNQIVNANIFDGLVTYDSNYKLVPQLAQRWETSADGLSITFHLRPDVRWHDGTPFTSADVAYSALEVVKKTSALGANAFAAVKGVDTPDAHTAVLRLAFPAPVVWSYLHGQQFNIVPRHLYAGSDPLTHPRNASPLGNGPYRFKEWVRGSHIALVRNSDYWDKQKPYFETLTFKIIPDAGAREAALESGEILYSPHSPVPLSSARRLAKSKDVVVDTKGWEGLTKVFFFDFNLKKKVFQDVRVRRAFAHAIDRQAISNVAWFGFAKPSRGPIPPEQKQHFNAEAPDYAFDPKKAEALLDEAGLRRGADGVRLRINHVNHTFGEEYRRAGDLIKQQLKQVGVEVELINYDTATQLRKLFTDRDFDTSAIDYAPGLDPQIGVIRRFWSQSIKDGVPWSNGSNYASAATDAVIQGIVDATDPQERKKLIDRLQVLVQQDLPSISLVNINLVRIFSSKLKGVDQRPLGALSGLGDVSLAR